MKRLSVVCFTLLLLMSCATTKNSTQNDDGAAAVVDQEAPGGSTGGEQAGAGAERNVVVSEFILGPSDEIEIKVFRHDELNKKTRIPPDGNITLNLIGDIKAAGVGIKQLRNEVRGEVFELFGKAGDQRGRRIVKRAEDICFGGG